MPRLFVSLPTPQAVLPRLADVREHLRAAHADVAWEPREKLHCTLKFLGDTQEQRAAPLRDTIASIARTTPPFPVVYGGTGCFPDPRDPRIIWAGVTDTGGELLRLVETLESALAALGFDRERRRFHPHVTLGRVRGARSLDVLLATMETLTFENPPVLIQELELVKSTLRPAGSVYSPVFRTRLGG